MKTALFCVTALALLSFLSCEKDDAAFDPVPFNGTYNGTWTNKSTNATGPAQLTFTVSGSAKTVTITIDYGGNYLGMGDPAPFTLAGTYDDEGAECGGIDPLLGNFQATCDKDGKFHGELVSTTSPVIKNLVYDGTITAQKVTYDYTVTLQDGTSTTGVADMSK